MDEKRPVRFAAAWAVAAAARNSTQNGQEEAPGRRISQDERAWRAKEADSTLGTGERGQRRRGARGAVSTSAAATRSRAARRPYLYRDERCRTRSLCSRGRLLCLPVSLPTPGGALWVLCCACGGVAGIRCGVGGVELRMR